jgi:hypothetical protein
VSAFPQDYNGPFFCRVHLGKKDLELPTHKDTLLRPGSISQVCMLGTAIGEKYSCSKRAPPASATKGRKRARLSTNNKL